MPRRLGLTWRFEVRHGTVVTGGGSWLEPCGEFGWGGAYIEGGPWQLFWTVPHDVGVGRPVWRYGRTAGTIGKPSHDPRSVLQAMNTHLL